MMAAAGTIFEAVVVGVDGRPSGRDAIALARVLAAPQGRLALAHVHAQERSGARAAGAGAVTVEGAASLALLEREREGSAVDAALAPVAAASVGRGLHDLAEAHHADLLVVGSCSRGFAG